LIIFECFLKKGENVNFDTFVEKLFSPKVFFFLKFQFCPYEKSSKCISEFFFLHLKIIFYTKKSLENIFQFFFAWAKFEFYEKKKVLQAEENFSHLMMFELP
jgi:hypothetical protein